MRAGWHFGQESRMGRRQNWHVFQMQYSSKLFQCYSASVVPDGVRDSEHMPEDVLLFQVPNGTWVRVLEVLHIHSCPPEQKIGLLCSQNPHLDLENIFLGEAS